MKFSESWLRTFVQPDLSSSALADLLTMAGLEVEEMQPVAPAFAQVVVAQVLTVTKHPDADRLNVCTVDVGSGTPAQIVCGAPNVAAGLKVPCALPGAELPGGLTIKLAKVRGVASAGMLCSARELGISEAADGLLVLADDAPVGMSLRRYLDLDDQLFTLKLTPNRADCLSLVGIAREVAALTGAPLSLPTIAPVTPRSQASVAVHLAAPEACPRYCGRLIRGVDPLAPTPEWLRRRLERSGLRSISALVDVTNYLLLELGQPLHAFDHARLAGPITVRLAQAGEELTLLNEQRVALDPDVLVIADQEGPLAMAGIMGGAASGVSDTTRDVFLESAFFAPRAIAGRARRYNFGSDAAHRFERGVDFANCRQALERATALVLEICGGEAGPLTESVAEAHLPARPAVRLRAERTRQVLGLPLAADTQQRLLERLRLTVRRDGETFVVTPPSYRFDLEIEADLIEEIARLHGYEQIPARAPLGRLAMLPQTENRRSLARLRRQLADRGLQEVINFAFVEEAWERDFAGQTAAIRLANPIASPLAVLRSTLIGGLVANLLTNLRRKQSRVRLFELGRCFRYDADGAPVAGYAQPWRLGALLYGTAAPEGWGEAPRPVDFFDVKGEVEALLAPRTARFTRLAHPSLHPGRAAGIELDGQQVGFLGELHPEWVQKYELPAAPMLFEIDLDAARADRLPVYAEVSRFQPVLRDLAIVVDRDAAWQDLLEGMRRHAGEPIKEILLFDVYQGKGIPEGKKSLAFRVVMQDTQRTLLDAEIDAALARLTAYLEQNFAAQLRA